MNDLAQEIVSNLEPANGWENPYVERVLVNAAMEMLEFMTADDVEEILTDINIALRDEYAA